MAVAAGTAGGFMSLREQSATGPSAPDRAAVVDPRTRAQPAGLLYDTSSGAEAFAHPGALVVAGRDNYRERPFRRVSAAGGTVLIYLDPVIDNPHGRYHQLLLERSACGPAVPRWPGNHRANKWGHLTDFRPGSVLQQKLECVLETMVRENPHMAGWFVDDVGSRSWFPGIDWEAFRGRTAYREGAIALTRTFREVADTYGLVFLVNGTWSADDGGGGYPDRDLHGNALADGGVVEHHDGQLEVFEPYGCSTQWAAESTVTDGRAINYALTSTPAGTAEYVGSECFAYVGQQSNYGKVKPWGEFHPNDLPSQVTQPG